MLPRCFITKGNFMPSPLWALLVGTKSSLDVAT